MKETLVYGGSFNPPTLAHMGIVEVCQNQFPKADIWIMPSGTRKDKTLDIDRSHRLSLINAMIGGLANQERVGIDETELDDEVTETSVTVRKHQELNTDREFKYIFGTDSYLSMPSWDNGAELQKTLPMVLIPRIGHLVIEPGNNVEILNVDLGAMSSTAVREKLAQSQDVGSMVCRGVAEYIKTTRLYM